MSCALLIGFNHFVVKLFSMLRCTTLAQSDIYLILYNTCFIINKVLAKVKDNVPSASSR